MTNLKPLVRGGVGDDSEESRMAQGGVPLESVGRSFLQDSEQWQPLEGWLGENSSALLSQVAEAVPHVSICLGRRLNHA